MEKLSDAMKGGFKHGERIFLSALDKQPRHKITDLNPIELYPDGMIPKITESVLNERRRFKNALGRLDASLIANCRIAKMTIVRARHNGKMKLNAMLYASAICDIYHAVEAMDVDTEIANFPMNYAKYWRDPNSFNFQALTLLKEAGLVESTHPFKLMPLEDLND